MELKDKVLIRKPTDDEQRAGKIVTSDYLVSAVTIHSSVLKTLGWIDKVYRSKTATATYSNVREIKRLKKALNDLSKIVGNYTPHTLNEMQDVFSKFSNFIKMVEEREVKSWKDVNPPKRFVEWFKTPKQMLKVHHDYLTFDKLFENDLMDGVSYDYRDNEVMPIKDIVPYIIDYLNKIETNSTKKHTQTLIYEKELACQKRLEEKLGKNFSVNDYIKTLDKWTIHNINDRWDIDIEHFNGTWADLSDYLYSPNIISKIRSELGVKVRARSNFDGARRGADVKDKKRFEQIISKKKQILGDDFNRHEAELEIKQLHESLKLAKAQWEEARMLLAYGSDEVLKQKTEKLRQKYYYLKRSLANKVSDFERKSNAANELHKYEQKYKLVTEIIEETRSGEELSVIEEEELINAIRKQKAEQDIPYYTWRFVCDRIDRETADKIEKILEDNLNKGNGVGGEDGYINVTAFPMTKCFEFFVDYPKNSNLFRAFKKKGEVLSDILIEGVANHIKTSLVNCKGETYFNSPMGKTMNGDMLDWIGV